MPVRSSNSETTLRQLRRYESRNVTYQEADGSWPIVWTRARGMRVTDAEGRRYLDLTGAFGVAAAGHANPRVVRAGARQMGTLLHAMGDVHPHPLKGELARALSRLTFERWTRRPGPRIEGKCVFGTSGSEAVEMALKTAHLATGRHGIIAFTGGYHGLGYGALNATHRGHFRAPFLNQLREFGYFVDFPETETAGSLESMESAIRKCARTNPVGAILAEPFQARGGIRIPPPGFLRCLRSLADELGAVLILDEIYTGFGRTGRWFACEHELVVPDLICLGKALTGGFPLSACVGRSDLMDRAWPPSSGEAIHTSTYLGHPVGCAMALAQIAELESRNLIQASATRGRELLKGLISLARRGATIRRRARGIGLMAGMEFRHPDGRPATAESIAVMKLLLRRGYIVLPEGADSEVISFTPPLTISAMELQRTLKVFGEALEACVP